MNASESDRSSMSDHPPLTPLDTGVTLIRVRSTAKRVESSSGERSVGDPIHRRDGSLT